jgi:hypothetical protein
MKDKRVSKKRFNLLEENSLWQDEELNCPIS